MEETRSVNITTVYRLVKGERFLRISTTIENTVKDHILRALFPSGVKTDTVHAEVAFDVVERGIPLPDTRDWREPYKPVQPHQNFVDLSDGKRGVALLNRGLPQYEAVDDEQRTLALTLLRAHRAWNSIRLAHYPDQSGTQLQGTYTFEYAVLPHRGDWDKGGVLLEAEKYNIEPIVGAAGPGEGELPLEHSFLEIEGDGLVMNALKQGEWDTDAVIIRLSNPTTRDIKGAVKLSLPVQKAELVNLMETEVEEELKPKDGRINVTIPAKKIATMRLLPAR
jgi:mannosylglycerate hydrolase